MNYMYRLKRTHSFHHSRVSIAWQLRLPSCLRQDFSIAVRRKPSLLAEATYLSGAHYLEAVSGDNMCPDAALSHPEDAWPFFGGVYKWRPLYRLLVVYQPQHEFLSNS